MHVSLSGRIKMRPKKGAMCTQSMKRARENMSERGVGSVRSRKRDDTNSAIFVWNGEGKVTADTTQFPLKWLILRLDGLR